MSDQNLEIQISSLRDELSKINNHRYIKVHNSMPRMLGFQFMRGLAFGLGSVVGATVLVSVLVYFLSTIDFIPIIGEWAKEILIMLQPTK
ncbi:MULTISPECIES: DUF5665 domain-containing protein [unclassified Lentilitoribacter]|jgi:hypothetical protein|uniref:DUF5665 domain-containing protein n=1 Tax=unclassified Lentilitoribacter TaxID=2647570 RepID=UPI0013A6F00C|nr:DUF5665 domain-containing protein [Lentilitoribacter sp. Alg239-R112]